MTPLHALLLLLLVGLTVLGIWNELIVLDERRRHEDAMRAMHNGEHSGEHDEVDEAFVDAWMVIARERGFPSTDDQ